MKMKTTLMTASFPCNYVNLSFIRSFIGTKTNEQQLIWRCFPLFLILWTHQLKLPFPHWHQIWKEEEEGKKELLNLFLFKMSPTFFHVQYQLYSKCVRMFVYSFIYIRQCQIHLSEAAGYELFKRNTQINGLVLHANGITTSKKTRDDDNSSNNNSKQTLTKIQK